MARCSFSFVIPLVALMLIRIPTVRSIIYATCKSGVFNHYCRNFWSTECCSSGFFQSSSVCCSPTSCNNGYFGYNTCWQYTDSKCCYRTAGSSSSCCNYYDYSRTSSSRYWSSYSKDNGYYYTAPIGAIVGGVIGGLVLLVLLIVIPVVLCGVCAAGANRRGRTAQQTTVVTTQNQIQPNQGAFVNRGYAPPTYGQAVPPPGQGMPQTGAVQPPPYNQAVMFAGPGNTGAPPTAAMYPQPGGQYPPPAAVNPPQTGGQYPPPAPEDANNIKNAPNAPY